MWEGWYLLLHAFESNRIAVPREKSLFGNLQVRFMCRRHYLFLSVPSIALIGWIAIFLGTIAAVPALERRPIL